MNLNENQTDKNDTRIPFRERMRKFIFRHKNVNNTVFIVLAISALMVIVCFAGLAERERDMEYSKSAIPQKPSDDFDEFKVYSNNNRFDITVFVDEHTGREYLIINDKNSANFEVVPRMDSYYNESRREISIQKGRKVYD